MAKTNEFDEVMVRLTDEFRQLRKQSQKQAAKTMPFGMEDVPAGKVMARFKLMTPDQRRTALADPKVKSQVRKEMLDAGRGI